MDVASYGENSTGMDAELWSTLQHHIDLKMIYAKLPVGDLFRLRSVCKEWNRLAITDRQFLEESFKDPIPEPYFLIDGAKWKHRLLTYNASSEASSPCSWNWSPLPPARRAVAGLLCQRLPDSNSYRVFDVHTRMFHALPSDPWPQDQLPLSDVEPLVGMTVDTSVFPYSYQVILGHKLIGTRIFDSESDSWTHKPSAHDFDLWKGADGTTSKVAMPIFNIYGL